MTLPLSSTRISSHQTQFIHDNWLLTSAEAGAFEDPGQLKAAPSLAWRPAIVPGTVAQSDGIELNHPPATSHNYDAQDHWYRCAFVVPDLRSETSYRLRFHGLATMAQVWLNGNLILSASNMFVPYVVDVTDELKDENELAICFRSLTAELAARRPRPRWKTALINNQQLRWVRTTLLGLIPGWTPPVAPVGPWREIALEQVEILNVVALDLQSYARAGTGIVKLQATLQTAQTTQEITGARLHVGSASYPVTVTNNASDIMLTAEVEIADVALWWPHTHGEPKLLPCHIEVQVGDNNVTIDCGLIGFKEVVLNRDNGAVQLEVN
ncbi:MAG: hypothetical protein JOZ57_11695, partial [Abitibacteriaceae bacterium]|nr:hypothetical protein [Abditibacteriaceae bacterium]